MLKGERHAFKTIVELNKDVLFTLICSIVKNSSLAEDLLQDVFIKVYQNIHTFNYKSNLSTWLYRIAINTSYNHLKGQKPHTYYKNETSLPQPMENKGTLTKMDRKKYIQKAIYLLKPDEALILQLHYLCDLKIKEIESITAFSTSKIKTDLHRGRKNLEYALKRLLGAELKEIL